MEGFCRACLNKFSEPTELLQYCESNRRLFVYCTGLQVKRNDTFTFQLCKECYLNLKFACKFKKQCRTSDKKFKRFQGLRKDGENIDFNNYLKNFEDSLTLRLPIGSSSSTPAHQKNYNDDDNESTCTSIQNFMSDMLQGEEMLPTEAKIIREVIQEEADILDDSLDSHWLQDDGSIDDDLGMDFNFAGFSTPHSINNDHCYTPRRLTDNKEDTTYYATPKDVLQPEETQLTHDQDMPLLEISENINIDYPDNQYDLNNINEPDIQAIVTSNQNDMPLLDDCDIKIDGIIEDYITMENLQIEFHNDSTEKPNNEQITVVLNKGVASKVVNSPLTNELEFYMNKVELNKTISKPSNGDNDKTKSQDNEKYIDTVLNEYNIDTENESLLLTQDLDQYIDNSKVNVSQKVIQSPVKFELDQYINKVELKKKSNIATNQNKINEKHNEKCYIDRNLELALRNDDSQEFSLDQLLISPQVSIRSGASTPTINNILFGTLTPRNTGKVVPELRDIAVKEQLDPTDFLEGFFKDNNQHQSSPKKESKESKRRYITVKDMNKLKGSKVKTQRKIIKGELNGWKELTKTRDNKQNKRNRGYKDIKRLKNLLKPEHKIHSETSDTELSQPKTKLNGQKEAYEFVDANRYETSDIEMLDNETSDQITEQMNNEEDQNHSETSDNETLDSETPDNETLDHKILYNDTLINEPLDIEMLDCEPLQKPEPFEDNELIDQTPKNIDDDDIDISISNLLKFDDNVSVDLNMSIASDFLKSETLEEDADNDNDLNEPEYLFKMPFSPPDKKYDLDKNLCKICDMTYKSTSGLRLHFIKIHKQQLPRVKKVKEIVPKVCPKCGKSFKDPSNFHKHIKKHEDPDNFKCEYCTLEFPTRGRFNIHITRTHANEVALKLKKSIITIGQDKDGNNKSREQNEEEGEAAKDSATNEEDIDDIDKNNGQRKEEGKKKKEFICPTCGKVLTTSGNFHVHIRRHNKTYTVRCDICNKGFIRRYDLNVHKATHSKDYPFGCQYCTNKYRSRHLLVGHMYRHLGKERFKCEVCDRHFISDQYLRQHYRTDMCVKNRKALEDKRGISNIAVTYKPYVHKPTKESEIMECTENVTEGGSIETNEDRTEEI